MKKLLVLAAVLVAMVACSDDETPAPPTGPGPVYQPPTSPISGWTYLDSLYTYVSGAANIFGVEQRRQTPDTITVLLFDKNVGCVPTPVGIDTLVGAWVAVQFPDTTARTYQQTEVWCEFGVRTHSSTVVTGGLFGKAGLTFVDLDGQKRVRGWIDMSGNNLPIPPPDEITARGTFDVPYCPPPGWSPMPFS